MVSPNKILMDMAIQFREYEARFDIIRLIDLAIVDDSSSFEEVSHEVIHAVKQLLCVEKCTICIQTNDKLKYIFQNDVNNTWPKLKADQLQKLRSEEFVFIGSIPNQTEKNTLFMPCKSSNDIHLAFVLQDNMPVAEASRLCEKETVEFIKDVSTQLGILFQNKVTKLIDAVKDKLINAFFENELKPRRSWELIVEHAASFLPDCIAFAIEPVPQVQILTCSTKDRYMSLRATQGKYYPSRNEGERKAVGDVIPLRVDETVCGLLVERNEDVLYVNPKKDNSDRYKAYMFGDSIPESELVIAIRHEDELIALINLEHEAPGIFQPYHISLLQEAAKFLSPFVNALLSREARLYDKEIGLLYVMTNLLHRMRSLYRHKIRNLLIEANALTTNLKKDLNHVKGKTSERVTQLAKTFLEIRESSESFLVDMPEYVNFSKVDISREIKEAVAEFEPDKQRNNENVEFQIIQSDKNLHVYATRMLREHIYNIVKNSMDAIRNRRQSNKTEGGEITITISKFKLQDARKKETSPARVSIEIKDNGGGVSEETYPNIMQFGFTTKRKLGGSGFGLAAAQEYMQFVGGGLELKNHLGEGLTVILYLQEYVPDYHERLIKLNTWKEINNVT